MRFDARTILLLGGATLIAACAPVDPGFGDTVRYNSAAQTIDPDPQYGEEGAKPGASGAVAAKASERYRKGQTKPVRRESTGSGGSGGGGGSSGPK